jgi:hypothetical protein
MPVLLVEKQAILTAGVNIQFEIKRNKSKIGNSNTTQKHMGALLITLAVLMSLTPTVVAEEPAVFVSTRATKDVRVMADPTSEFWRQSAPVIVNRTKNGELANLKMEVRSRWTPRYLYFLFVCPYEELNLKPFPNTTKETNELWNWDVAEVFIGSNFKDIARYKEFEVSPQGEWMDLDINLRSPQHETGWVWNSGFEHIARIDPERHVWYAAMKIPMVAIGSSAVGGTSFRINFFLSQGPPERHKALCWQPSMSDTFHVPERFGLLRLIGVASAKKKISKRVAHETAATETDES